MMLSVIGVGSLNGKPARACQIVVDHERIDVSTSGPKPDELWSFTDAAGHFHAYDQSKGVSDHWPTLLTRVEVVPCDHEDHDPDCDGANIIHYHCRACDEEVIPGMVPGPHYATIPGLSSWQAKVTVDEWPELGQLVSLRTERVDDAVTVERFGFAMVDGVSTTSFEGSSVTVDLVGVGPLGYRTTRHARSS